jgi:hypothetical protein
MELRIFKQLLKIPFLPSNIFKTHYRNYKILFKNQRFKNLQLGKMTAFNLVLLMSYYKIYNKKYRITCSDFNFLLNINLKDKKMNEEFYKKKNPKIIYLRSYKESLEDKEQVRNNFTKITSKYKEVDSYIVDLNKNMDIIEDLEKLLESFGTSLNELLNISDKRDIKPNELKELLEKKQFLFFNKYGDVKSYSLEEFTEISKADAVNSYFERLMILQSKHDLLIMNDYDYAFIIYLNNKDIDYSSKEFKVFRNIYFNLNFFNLKFFVVTSEHSPQEVREKLIPNNIYLVKRENSLSSPQLPIEMPLKTIQNIEIDSEIFTLNNITSGMNGIGHLRNDDSK